MTAQELIDILSQFDPDTIVRFSYDYGDHCHRRVAKEVEFVDLGIVEYDGYVEDFCLVDEESEDNQEFNTENCAIILQ